MLDHRRRAAAMAAAGATAASLPAVLLLALAANGAGCGESDTALPGSDAGGDGPFDGHVEVSVTLHPDAAPLPGETECKVVITHGIKVGQAKHVEPCNRVKYATNPPSGGDHWPIWAAYKQYDIEVPREMYVHDMEHGGVVLAYRCEAECPEVVSMLSDVFDKTKPDCVTSGVKARMILTPDPKLDAPIGAGAWGSTYVATCLDEASLLKFVSDSYGKGTEDICGGGLVVDELEAGIPCADGG